ncbi:MAG TPA: M1 family aminopeptidase, partial [Blastocatellia bacterium]
FNYGDFKKKSVTDDKTNYQIDGYATTNLPDYLRQAESIGGMAPSRLIDKTLVEAQMSIRLFNHWFSPVPYGRIAVTQQPQFSFGQSWPSLVYLPLSAYLDSTQRWQLIGLNSGFTDFIQEVTSHEVAHQWWGHIVGWSSFHDQWLSEGFADFSASLFLQYTEPKLDKYLRFWDQNRKTILEKDVFGRRPTDVGPIWAGLRLNTTKSPGSYNRLVYPKGGYVLHMLRWMMYDPKTGDQKFIEMMRDFVKIHFNENASTESFKAVVEKHMLPTMDLDGNKRMDWFFLQWVFGTEVPRYRLDYALTAESDGKVLLTGKITQSEVSDQFKMLVPIYLDFDGKISRLGNVPVVGNSTTPEFKVKLPSRPKRVLINYHYDVLAAESISAGK